jgi:hypothetical protein
MDNNLNSYLESLIVANDEKDQKLNELGSLVEELNNTIFSYSDKTSKLTIQNNDLKSKINSLKKEKEITKKTNKISKLNEKTTGNCKNNSSVNFIDQKYINLWLGDYIYKNNVYSKMNEHYIECCDTLIKLKNNKNTLNFILSYLFMKNGGDISDIPVRYKCIFTKTTFECPICLDDNLSVLKKNRLGCSHEFCIDCVKMLYNSNMKCPICKTKIKENIIYKNNHLFKTLHKLL